MSTQLLIEFLEGEEAREESAFRDACRGLGEHLIRMADAERIRPNELGEMQSRGSFIDSRAGALQRVREDLGAVRGFLAADLLAADLLADLLASQQDGGGA